jgi:hypothetical protein
MNIYGTPEYRALRNPNLEKERLNPITVLASEDEIRTRYNLVYEDSTTVDDLAVRTADDEYFLDPECLAVSVPYTYCLGYRFRAKPSSIKPRCVDNNSTLDTMLNCTAPDGTPMTRCVQVAYTQTAFIGLCDGPYKNDSHCGTFLEVHMRHGSPYNAEEDIISSVKLETRNVSGYYTTVLPVTWQGDPKRLLCAYYEDYFRIGSIVFVNPAAPRCCCPPTYSGKTRTGSFFCPVGTGSSQDAHLAPYANTTKQLLARDQNIVQYPWCPTDLSGPDV